MAGARRRDRRFFRWFRTLPLLALAAALVVCLGFDALPDKLVRSVLYPVKYADTIEDACNRYGLDENLVCAVIRCESGWDDDAVSSAGAEGLMQVMPSTAADLVDMGIVDGNAYDPDNLTDPATCIEFGCAYLSYLQGKLDSQEEVIAAYNAGLSAVQGWLSNGGEISEVIEYGETQAYLQRVLKAQEGYEKYYPEGITSSD